MPAAEKDSHLFAADGVKVKMMDPRMEALRVK